MSEEDKVEGTVNDGLIADPELYDRLSVPCENMEVAQKNCDDFYKEVCKLREKYCVPEMVIAYAVNVKGDEQGMRQLRQAGFRGGRYRDNLIMHLIRQTKFGVFLSVLLEEADYLIKG